MATEKENSRPDNVMDYDEHERTYGMFLQGSKLLTMISVALLIAMAFGFFAGGGLLGGILAFIVLAVLGYFFI